VTAIEEAIDEGTFDADRLGEAAGDAVRGHESRAEVLRRRRQERRTKSGPRVLTLPVPPGDIHISYRRLTDAMRTGAVAAAKGNRTAVAVELLIRACHEVLLTDPRTGEIAPAALDTAQPDVPVKIDGRLADLLGLNGSTVYEIAMQAFDDGDGPNTDAMAFHLEHVQRWSRGEDLERLTSTEADELLGEAEAATGA